MKRSNFSDEQVEDYVREHDVIVNPLHAQGYTTIGCNRCTTPVLQNEPPRAGRWRHLGPWSIYCGINPTDMLDDATAQVEISVFNELYEKHRDKLKEDALLVVCGKVQDDQFSGGLRVAADELLDLDGLRARYAARLKISMNGGADAKRLQQVLAPYRASGTGACQVVVSYGNGKGACEVVLGEGWRVRPEAKLLSDLGDWLAPENVELTFSS